MTGLEAGESGLHLGRPRRSWRSLVRAAVRLARAPRGLARVVQARLTNRRLRARQILATLIGIDHRLALPARVLERYTASPNEVRSAVNPLPSAGGSGPSPDPRRIAVDRSTPAELGDEIVILGDGVLVAGAKARIETIFEENRALQALYGDALVRDEDSGPALPLLPPTYDPVLLASVDYLGSLLAFRRTALDQTEPPAGSTDAAFRIGERHGSQTIGHLPEILSVRHPGSLQAGDRDVPPRGEGARAARIAALRGHLDRTGQTDSRIDIDVHGLIRVTHPIPALRPLASVIVPTRDRLDLLRPCLDSLRDHTDWQPLEILVCDNDSREPETLAYLAMLEGEGRGVVVPCPGPFNFAAMNNAAAARARGDLLVFLNNDVEAFQADWLSLMAREALRPDVGAVGAKLLDGAGRIQHGGIVLGTGGLVTHGHRHFPGDAPGYLSALRATHAVSAVTAACLVVEAEKFRAVGGFDDKNFAVDFNDVDLCLRLNETGHRTLLVPAAVLHHREAASRRWTPEARQRHGREIAALKKRWGPLLAQDPHYHPGFDPALSTHARLRAGFPSADPQTVRRPVY